MRTMLRSKVTLLFMTLGLLLAIPAIALADVLQDEITAGSGAKTISTGAANSFENSYWIREGGQGGMPGCDVDAASPATFKLTGFDPNKVTVSSPDGPIDGSPKLVFSSCSTSSTTPPGGTTDVEVTFSSNTPGFYPITAQYVSGGKLGATFNVNDATLNLTVFGVTEVTPQPDATDVPVNTNVTAKFSQDLDPSTINTTNFKLVKDGDPTNTPIPATVTYDSNTDIATLNPHGTSATNLEPGTKYNATIVGGASGVKTTSGTGSVALEQNKTWSFTTFNPNTAPVAINDNYNVNEDGTLNVPAPGVLGNDTDANSNPLTAALVSGPSHDSNFTFNSDGSFSYAPDPDFFGEDTFTYKANDGTADSNVATVTIDVASVNDAPSFDLPASPNQTVNEDSGAQSVANFATNISDGPANESSQTVSFNVTNDNNSLFTSTGQPAIDANGKLTYTLAQGAIGTATVSVRAQDDGGTTNDGVDTSAAQTFKINVNYDFAGFLQPINWTAHQVLDTNVSTFKQGSTIPVKFQLKDANGNVVQAGSATSQSVDETVYTEPATTGTLYKWDATAQQYIYNWSTKGSQSGFYYKIGVKIDDGNTYYTYISLR